MLGCSVLGECNGLGFLVLLYLAMLHRCFLVNALTLTHGDEWRGNCATVTKMWKVRDGNINVFVAGRTYLARFGGHKAQ